jgi:hypothetical protein
MLIGEFFRANKLAARGQRLLWISILSILTALAIPQNRNFMVDDFKAIGSDGKVYRLRTITSGKPVLIVYLQQKFIPLKVENGVITKHVYRGFEEPNGIPDLNRLSAATLGKMRVVGLTDAPGKDLPRLVKESKAKFLLLGDEHSFSTYGLKMHLLEGRTLYHLQTALILPSGKLIGVWPGYSRKSLEQVQKILQREVGVALGLKLASFPSKAKVGEGSMYGLPPPEPAINRAH